MDALIAGYHRFRQSGWPEHRRRFSTLATEGQSPRAMVIACSDSRVDPSMIFDAAPGEIFTVRNIAALVPPYAPDDKHHGTSAALEFGVRVLRVSELIVLGHAMCGGVNALLHGSPLADGEFINAWVSIAEPARRTTLAAVAVTPEEAQTICELETIKLSLANLRTFPWIAEAEARGDLRLHGASFDIRSGLLSRLGDDGQFRLVTD
ncbi:MAG: carbonic anhydrase [Acidibrevibacterium sp.]|jgi:carbonic anhydrase|uniref:carbonic anhydrase n=1 Tax=Acidibrevibacterium fodinaquatile TaxID=1969806 RepID=UPI000E0DEFBA|nr:carbonic anhydrase [Acidibrevibacterium fodinaquatile]MCA7119753.1 carbonic anhydrase [Acidibrevibacterium fodinaquatile]